MASILTQLEESDLKLVKNKIDKLPVTPRPETGCQEVIVKGTKRDGSYLQSIKKSYPIIRVTRKKQAKTDKTVSACLPIHVVLYYIHYKRVTRREANEDISHLCGRRNCININHITIEPHQVNCSRRSCHRFCKGHEGFPACIRVSF